MSAISKSALAAQVAEQTGTDKKTVERILTSVLDSIVAAVAAGDKVQLVGFGSFESRERAARTGKNPRTGESIEIAATVIPAFKAGQAFKDAVKGNE